ncbi:MAG: LIC_10190 family membrane protein [Candidatus Nanopelagicales bacterium]
MLIASGTALVLATWSACVVALTLAGLAPSLVMTRGRWTPASARLAMWWGLFVLVTLIVALSAALPLGSAAAGAAVVVTTLALGLTGSLMAVRSRRRRRRAAVRRGWWLAALSVGAAVPVIYLAAAALGPVTNYDSGLYHLGAIRYAADFSAIPGLANLYFPLGYANAEFPLAAFLGNGPWAGVGFRLLNGLILALVVIDVLLRARAGRLGAGFFVLSTGLAAALVPMVALSDYWVTSPTSDSAVFALTLLAVAYLVDAVASHRNWLENGSVAVLVSVLIVMLRPTMVVFAATVVLVVVVAAVRARHISSAGPVLGRAALVSGAVLIAAAVTLARDYVLSGWVLYPLSVHSFDVPWLALDPADTRNATLGNARNPSDLWNASEGWSWIGPWMERLPSQWETFEFALLAVIAVMMVSVAARCATGGLRWRAMVLAMAPSGIMTAFWWAFTPPSYRFVWGPLFTLGAIPIGWSLARLHRSAATRTRRSPWQWLAVGGLVVPVGAVVAFSLTTRFDAGSITERREWAGVVPYAVAPIQAAETKPQPVAGGLVLQQPIGSDQCWTAFPLCTPQLLSIITLRGEGIQAGFAVERPG